jgi:hypothetical protein
MYTKNNNRSATGIVAKFGLLKSAAESVFEGAMFLLQAVS